MKQLFSLILRLTVLLLIIRAINSTDEYVKDLKRKCTKSKRPYFCVTFRLAKFIQDFDYDSPSNSAVRLIKIERQEGASDLLSHPRYLSEDSEQQKFMKFLQRKLLDFLSTHGLAFEVPKGVRVVQGRSLEDVDEEDARGHGSKLVEKKIFILSILMIAKLIKILLIVNMIFFALLLIKKIILVAAIVFPSVLSHIKSACQQHHQHHVPIIAEAEAPAHSSSWFGWRQDTPSHQQSYWHPTDRQSYWPIGSNY